MVRIGVARFVQRGIVALVVMGAPPGAPLAFAQIELGVMQGVVTDEDGTPLEGVTFRSAAQPSDNFPKTEYTAMSKIRHYLRCILHNGVKARFA